MKYIIAASVLGVPYYVKFRNDTVGYDYKLYGLKDNATQFHTFTQAESAQRIIEPITNLKLTVTSWKSR